MPQAGLPPIGAEVPELPPIGAEVPEVGSPMNFAVVNGQRVPVDDGPLDLIKGAAHTLNPIPAIQQAGQALPLPKALGGGGVIEGPVNAVKGLLQAQNAVKAKGDAAYQHGDYLTAARHYVDWLLPVIGPAIDKAADEMQQGRPWRGAGEAIGIGLGLTAPKALENAQIKVPAVAKNPNAVEAAAVEAGQARGIPVDAGTATGNRFVRAVQSGADQTPIGSVIAERSKNAQAQAMTRVGGELADQVHPSPVTAEQAGAALKGGTEDLIRTLDASANVAYDKLRAIEAKQPMPVTVTPAKQALKPIYDRLKREASLVPLMDDRARALTALDRLMTGPEVAPVSVVDGALSDLKRMARGAAMPELRSQGQGLAAQAVQALEDQVQAAVKRAGPDAVKALEQGRAAVKTKAAVADILKAIKDEPVKAYKSATAPKDTAVEHLRQLQQVAPDVLPQVGRAWLEDALTTATQEGGFEHAAKLSADWNRLGPQTKNLIFGGPQNVKALDQYFLLAKKLAESPNPSGTAKMSTSVGSLGLVFTAPQVGVPLVLGAGGLSKILRSPSAVRLLIRGLTLTLGPGRASRAAAVAGAADVIRAAQEAGVTALNPARAQDQGQ